MAPPFRRRAALSGPAALAGPASLATAPFEATGAGTNVKDHGARGDGRADDSGAIQAAIDAAAAAGGGIVL